MTNPTTWPFRCLLLLLVLAPLPLGSNRSWSLALLALGVAATLAWAWWAVLRGGRSPLAYLQRAWLPLAALWAFVALVAGQWGMAGNPPNAAQWLVTADRHLTLQYLLASLAYTGMFMLVLLLVHDKPRLRSMTLVLVASGVVQALLAIVLLSAGASYQFMWQDITHGTQATGTFVNRNHLAGYLYLCLAAGIGLLLGTVQPPEYTARRARDKLVLLMKFVLSPRMLLRLLLVVMVIALVLTRSRMGNTAFFVAMLVLGAAVAFSMPQLRRQAMILVVSLLVIDVVVVGQWVGLEKVMERIEGTALEEEDRRSQETVQARLEPALRTLPLIAQRPVLGHGGGTYYSSFTPHKTGDMVLYDRFFDHAHNDYAEIAADTGLLGLGLLMLVALATLVRALGLLRDGQGQASRGTGFAALAALVCLGLHSMVDFNLHIPANAITFTALLAMAWAAPWRARRPSVAQADDAA